MRDRCAVAGAVCNRHALDSPGTQPAHRGYSRLQQSPELGRVPAGGEKFRRASQNTVYADIDGNIATGSRLDPMRNPGHDGAFRAGWTDEYEWQGYIPFEQLPNTFNPRRVYRHRQQRRGRPGLSYPIEYYFAYGYRAQRIVDMIENAPARSPGLHPGDARDNKDLNAEPWCLSCCKPVG